uniref:Phosphotransferase n=1 Tax=Timema tahoe TaxID=61484 RepID=A0A7R9FIY0_9NEOP|nr:unnamed protein product [Timema tahoe]
MRMRTDLRGCRERVHFTTSCYYLPNKLSPGSQGSIDGNSSATCTCGPGSKLTIGIVVSAYRFSNHKQLNSAYEGESGAKGVKNATTIAIVNRNLLGTAYIKKGLAKETHPEAVVKCFITYVTDLPDGKETGDFLALDLGGTNFRILSIHLENGKSEMINEVYELPKDKIVKTSVILFDHIAECLHNFIVEHSLQDKLLPLGFTFSFPLVQVALDSGLILKWTKGFDAKDAVGQDPVTMLREAIKRKGGMKVDVRAIVNDTTGTLIACAWKDTNCRLGLIVGTGTNMCYVEKVENAEIYQGDRTKEYVIINTESGNFGSDGSLDFVRTEFDREIDSKSINAGHQLHEKMISGMYLGELIRLVIVKLVEEKVLFGGKSSDKLKTAHAFECKYVTEILTDTQNTFVHVKKVLEEMHVKNAKKQDWYDLYYICDTVSRRGASLAAIGVATLINKMGFSPVTAGIDGTLYRLIPGFHDQMMEVMKKFVDTNIEFKLMLSEDGSGRGAALAAASGYESKSTS